MFKRILLFTFFAFVFSVCVASVSLFPNEILYQSRSTVGIKYSEQAVGFSISSKFPINTLFKYRVEDPMLAGLMQAESSFFLHAVSDSNAIGLFQMKPFTASEIGALNPFNPYNDKKVSDLLKKYTNAFGSVDYALGAYHIGYYGVQKLINSGNNPLNDSRINDYVKKINSFQRLYKEGDKITLKDYIWFDISMNLSEANNFDAHIVVPEFFLGSFELGINNFDGFNITFNQEFFLFWFLQAYVGYNEGVITGLTLKSNDWYNKITVKYDFSKDDLIWVASSSFDLFYFDIGFSKTNIFFKPGFTINNKYSFEIPVFYKNHVFVPGIAAIIKF